MQAAAKVTDTPNPIGQCGSIVQTIKQVVGEWIPVTGAPFQLYYYSDRVIGRKGNYTIQSVLSGSEPRSGVTGYNLRIQNEIGTQVVNQDFAPVVNLKHSYLWSGKDASGRETWGPVLFQVMIRETSGANFYERPNPVVIGSLKAKKLGIGGWVPSIWHFYDAAGKRLLRGDGTKYEVEAKATATGFRLAEEDGSLVYDFDSTGRLVQTRTGLTGQLIRTFAYDARGFLSSITEPFGQVTSFVRDGSGVLSSIKAPNGQVTVVTLNANGYLASVANPKSEKYIITYKDAGGLIQTFTKPNGALSTFSYDSDGNLIKDLHSGGASISLAKIESGVRSTSAMGRVSEVTYSEPYKNEVETKPNGFKTSLQTFERSSSINLNNHWTESRTFVDHPQFGPQAKVLSVQQESGFGNISTSYTHEVDLADATNPFSIKTYKVTESLETSQTTSIFTGSNKTNLTSTKLGRTSTAVIDDYERLISFKRGNLNPIQLTYANQDLTQIQQGSRLSVLGYDAATHLLTSIKNPLNQVTRFSYDSAQRLSRQTLPDLRQVAYSYDFAGNLISITPPGRPAHLFSLNSKELLDSYKPPALNAVNNFNTVYAYNNDRQLTKITRPDGKSIVFQYDPVTAELKSMTQGTSVITLQYNSGLVQSFSDTAGNMIIQSYNGLTVSNQSVMINSVYGLSYSRMPNNFGKVAQEDVVGSNGTNTVLYSYDVDGVLSEAGDLVLNIDVPDGKLTGSTFFDLTDAYTYNAYGEVTGYTAKRGALVLYSYSLTRDLLGRVTKKIETLSGVTKTFDYRYDLAGRLIEVKKNGVVVSSYGYDSNSNRISGVVSGTTTNASYDAQDRLNAYNSNNYAYNLNGELLSKTNTLTSQVTNYMYDVWGNLRKVALPGKTINYEIDPLNRRLGRKIGTTLQKRFLYDPENRLIAEFDGTGAWKKRYIYATKSHVPDYFVDSSGAFYRLVTDHLGSVRLIVRQSTGAVVQKMEHDEFGRVVQDTAPGYTPFGFAGGIYDPDTKLVRFGARDYDPEIGRWTSKDPILFGGGSPNVYSYVHSDPINWVDPSGLSECSDHSNLPIAKQCGGQTTGGSGGGSGSFSSPGTPASAPVGRSGSIDLTPSPSNNVRCEINGRSYSGHALDRMQGRGIVPSVVENTIGQGTVSIQANGNLQYFDATNYITVITNSNGGIVTVRPGAPK